MRKLLSIMIMLTCVLSMNAVPAKRGQWKSIQLTNGSVVKVQLVGDEFYHYWVDENGQVYNNNEDDTWSLQTTEATENQRRGVMRRAQANKRRLSRRNAFGDQNQNIIGKKNGIVILVNFTDKAFTTDVDTWTKGITQDNYTTAPFVGSVKDYFKAQSFGKFELDFDVVGPFTLAHNVAYYGKNVNKEDAHPAEAIIEALHLADQAGVDFSKYDWDGDGIVEQVFVLYAGKGEADGGSSNTIWPHEYELSAAKEGGDGSGPQLIDGVTIDTYACGSELNGNNKIDGIGTICHEFSHCLGYPDMYDAANNKNYGMANWDIMDAGSYNGDGYRPAGYTSYERKVAGWIEPEEITSIDTIKNMPSLQSSGKAYIMYNPAHRDEYYLLENRQLDGWDASLSGTGLLVLHIDYDETTWLCNAPNSTGVIAYDEVTGAPYSNLHERATIFKADNEDGYYSSASDGRYLGNVFGDTYPYLNNNKLTKKSTPAAILYNKNSDGTYFMHLGITDIIKNDDRTVSFNITDYSQDPDNGEDDDNEDVNHDYIFYESFNSCKASGGNDGLWSGSIANGELITDNPGWVSTKAYGGNQCAKFGTNKAVGIVTTPTFNIEGEAVLTFKAGCWNSTSDGTALSLSVEEGDATLSESTFTMTRGAWTTYKTTINGNGPVSIQFMPGKRFFLDEVIVTAKSLYDGIDIVSSDITPAGKGIEGVYSISGQYVGKGLQSLPHGMYIVNGKKVIK